MAVVSARHLKSGATMSCGCARATLGGLSTNFAYGSYSKMIDRCTNPKHDKYAYYGGRGITVCDRWSGPSGFQNFLADMGPRPEGTSIDRIDNDGNYEPSNCRWATAKEQARNRRPARLRRIA
jgi:hypothetical protein